MENTTIYHDVKGIVTFCQWLRILPINRFQVTETRKVGQQKDSPINDYQDQIEPKFNIKPTFYFKYSQLQNVLNCIILILLVAVGGFSQAFLYNLSSNATQKIGFMAYVLTFYLIPILIVFLCNKNTPKVGYLLLH